LPVRSFRSLKVNWEKEDLQFLRNLSGSQPRQDQLRLR
jgi:hypothetical protein